MKAVARSLASAANIRLLAEQARMVKPKNKKIGMRRDSKFLEKSCDDSLPVSKSL